MPERNKDSLNGIVKGEEAFIDSLKGGAFSDQRMKAYTSWKNTPVPTTRDEYWKYTRLSAYLNKPFAISENSGAFNVDFFRGMDCHHLVFVNGIFNPEQSTEVHEDGFILTDIATAKSKYPALISEKLNAEYEGDYFSLLNSAFHQTGPFIHLGKNKVPDKAIHISHLISDSDRLVNIKGMIHALPGASAQIIETWDQENGGENLTNARMDITVEANARLKLVKVQSMGNNQLICQDFIEQEKDSNFFIHTISTDGRLIRNNLNAVLRGENAECNFYGLYMARGKEHVDNHTKIEHAVPNCLSNELYKGILNEQSSGVFNGKVVVKKDAQKTNAFQSNANLLLTDEAQVYSKPELEIYADDVKCSHGSTTGQLDSDALFYLQSRGIEKNKARNLLLFAFAGEILAEIDPEEIKTRIESYISERYQISYDV